MLALSGSLHPPLQAHAQIRTSLVAALWSSSPISGYPGTANLSPAILCFRSLVYFFLLFTSIPIIQRKYIPVFFLYLSPFYFNTSLFFHSLALPPAVSLLNFSSPPVHKLTNSCHPYPESTGRYEPPGEQREYRICSRCHFRCHFPRSFAHTHPPTPRSLIPLLSLLPPPTHTHFHNLFY